MTNRPLSRGVQPLSKHQSVFEVGPEFSHLGYPDTSCEVCLPRNHRLDHRAPVSGQSRIFVLSKSTLPRDELYVTAILHNLITHTEGQSALNSYLHQGE